MGWSEGKGLGVKEDGLTVPILPKYKKDSEGFGYAGEKDNHWTQHHHDFEGLLKSLNGSTNASSNSNSGDEITFKSLEEKSKSSRARVHYRKFTRGKDLTLASQKDLANIFGKKTLDEVKRAPPPVVLVGPTIEKDENEKDGEEKTFGLMTVNTGKSVHDYFKEKMQALKRKHEAIEPTVMVEDSLDCEPVRKKAKKKRKHEATEPTVMVEDSLDCEPVRRKAKKSKNEEMVEDSLDCEPVKKKAKKSKNEESNEGLVEIQEEPVDVEPKKKRKKKSKDRVIQVVEMDEDTCRSEIQEEPVAVEPKKKKKKKSRENMVQIEKNIKDQDPEQKSFDSTENMLFELIQSQRREPVTPKVNIDPNNELNLTEMGSLVLQQVDPMGFVGSNFSDIIGYGLTTNVKLVTQSDSHQYQSDQILKLQYRKTSTSNQYQRKLRKKVGAFTHI